MFDRLYVFVICVLLQCENVVEEYEDDIIRMYKEEDHKKINEKLCVDLAGELRKKKGTARPYKDAVV